MVRFLHTADWQLGKPYGRVTDPGKQARLRQARYDAIGRIAGLAAEQQSCFVLIAGDLFDATAPTRSDVSRACSAIGRIPCPVFVIPGNHDHGGPGSLWEEAYFCDEQRSLAKNMRVLLKREPEVLDGAVILPCPLLRKAEPRDPTAWISRCDTSGWGDLPRIVLAHGSVQGFGGDDDSDDEKNPAPTTNRIELDALPPGEIDYIALGDWHGLKQVAPNAWYCGCHEQDRFPRGSQYRSGQVLSVEVGRGVPPQVESMDTGLIRWQTLQQRFLCDGDLATLKKRLQDALADRVGEDLLLLELDGTLSLSADRKLQQLLKTYEARLIRLERRGRHAVIPNDSELQSLTGRAGDPLVARVASRLEEALAEADDDPRQQRLVQLALRELHGLCSPGG